MSYPVIREKIKRGNMEQEEFCRYISLLLQLDGLTINVLREFEQKLEDSGLYKQKIKKSLNDIKKELKNNFKCEWMNFSTEQHIAFGDDGEVLERMVYRLFGLEKGTNISFAPDFYVGERVWTRDDNNNPILCEVESVEIMFSIGKDSREDSSYYTLQRISNDSLKPIGVSFKKGESKIFKSKKLLYEDTKIL